MIAPFTDSVAPGTDQVQTFGDTSSPNIDRVRPFNKVDPSGGFVRYSGPTLPRKIKSFGFNISFSPNSVANTLVTHSPNAAALNIVFSPNSASLVSTAFTPNQVNAVGAITEPVIPANVSADYSPANINSIGIQHSPASPVIDSVQYRPNQPVQLGVGKDVFMPTVVSVDSNPNAPTVDKAEWYEFVDPILGPWNHEKDAGIQTEYIVILVPFGYADDPNTGNYPSGYENEIVKVRRYLNTTGSNAMDLVETDDALIGGVNSAQVLEVSDRGVSWQYVDFAQDPTLDNYKLYRHGGGRRPYPIEVSSVEVEKDVAPVSVVDANNNPNDLASVGIASSPNQVSIDKVVGGIPGDVTQVTADNSPASVASVSRASNPNSVVTPVIEHDPNAPASVIAVKKLVQHPLSVSVTHDPNAISSLSVSRIGIPQDVEIEYTPNAPASVIAVKKLVQHPLSVSVTHDPNSVASITLAKAPEKVSTVSAVSPVFAPNQVTTIIISSSPVPVSTVVSGTNPAPVIGVGVIPLPGKPAVVLAEYTPAYPTVQAVSALFTSPVAVTSVSAIEVGLTLPDDVSTVDVSSNPNPASTVVALTAPSQTQIPVVSSSPASVSEVSAASAASFSNEYSLSFEGTNSYCDCGNLTAINSIANFSYSFWYKQVNSGRSVFMGNTDNKVGALHESDGNANFKIANRTHTIVGSPTLNQWHHVVVTFDGSVTTSKLYLDGVYKSIVTNESSTTSFQAGTRFYIGRGFATGYGTPLIDEFSMFTTTLSDGGGLSTGDTAGGDIASIYNSGVPTDLSSYSPLHWWRMGENDGGTGTTITDQGSGGNNGTLTNGPTFSTSVPT